MISSFIAAGILAHSAHRGGAPLSRPELQLSIGRPGRVMVQPGQLVDLRSGRTATLADVIKAAQAHPYLFLGENHATAPHQQMQADIIRALAATRKVSVGVEMFHRTKQDVLDKWSAQKLTETDFLTESDWKNQWGFDYKFYRPVFEAARELKLPLVGLNVPRDWVRAVSRGGYAALPMTARMQLPPDLGSAKNAQHKLVFDSLMGGHPMPESAFQNLYSAQVLWDEGMADSAAKYRAISGAGKRDLFVVIAGSGHVMYGQGINFRLKQRHRASGITVVMAQSDSPVDISRGLGDFVYLTKPEPKPN